ncbi:Major exported protein [invertebrate metagenome]|uniref:Major exported protein n=1 Tax=invertebrate metagenome TaxID=1711999 RepID=A0A2H9T332_9ZZZZ
MNFPAYLHIKGTQQGLIIEYAEGTSTPGSVGNKWQEGHEDEILVQGFSHDMLTTKGLREHEKYF